MTHEVKTQEEKMDEGYATLAKDPEYLATQELRRRFRGLGRSVGDKMPNEDEDGNIIEGTWSVSVTTGEPWEQSHTSQIAVFDTLEKAQEFFDAYTAALDEADANEYNQYESSYCSIGFIPFYTEKIAFHIVYEVETTRDPDNLNVREIESVRSTIYSDAEVQKRLAKGEDKLFSAIWNDRSLAVFSQQGDGSLSKEVISSSEFPHLNICKEYDPYDKTEYDSSYETFLTFDPKNVILEKAA